jgi:hypothetical protein
MKSVLFLDLVPYCKEPNFKILLLNNRLESSRNVGVANMIIEMVKFRISKVERTLREHVGELLYYTLTIRRKKGSITK